VRIKRQCVSIAGGIVREGAVGEYWLGLVEAIDCTSKVGCFVGGKGAVVGPLL